MVLSTLRPSCERAHRGAAAEMRDDHPAARNLGRNLLQPAGDELVGQAVEAVAPHALVVEMFRDRVVVGQRIVAAVKRRVEARDLRQLGDTGEDSADGCEIVRLVQWRQRDQAFEVGDSTSASIRTGRS